MQFAGPSEFTNFWNFLKGESERGVGVVVAAYFDQKLGSLLGMKRGDFHDKIELGLARRLLTQNECDDLHVMRQLRNSFAHNLEANTFDADKSQAVDGLKTWQIAVDNLPCYAEYFPTARERLLYVAAAFYGRLQQRQASASDILPEPPFHDTNAWPPVTDR